MHTTHNTHHEYTYCVIVDTLMYICPVHEHNHTRILVPEVLCSLGGPETQNVRQRRQRRQRRRRP